MLLQHSEYKTHLYTKGTTQTSYSGCDHMSLTRHDRKFVQIFSAKNGDTSEPYEQNKRG